MELSVVYSRALTGIEAPLVRVETHLSNGLPAFHIVGLPETAVRESKDRVRSAILNSHFKFPDRRITVNLAPADLPKEGGRFDLPIAVGILTASGQVPQTLLSSHEFLGELALDGSLRGVPGAIPAAGSAGQHQRQLVVANDCAPVAALAPASSVIAAPDLLTLCAHLNGARVIAATEPQAWSAESAYPDLAEVVGQHGARRALEIAASGGHHLLLIGPPGTGKSLLASRLPGILPPPDLAAALTGLALRQAFAPGDGPHRLQRPFRCPHHSASAAALVGGGCKPRPGEISLAHGGVLFLDELAEFSRHSLEVLREPMESGEIVLSRAAHKIRYPAQFQLVAAMNPCPCGYLGDSRRPCHCSPEQIQRYRGRLSGPLLDRIDLQVTVPRVPPAELLGAYSAAEGCAAGCTEGRAEGSAAVRARVCRSRTAQAQRQGCANAQLPAEKMNTICALGGSQRRYLESAALKMNLSGRALHRTLRVARTIADLAQQPAIATAHISEALAYRGHDLSA